MNKSNKKKNTVKKVKNVRATGTKAIKSDVQGSYTGVPENIYDRPVQDADDL